jgi:hypothetical protein
MTLDNFRESLTATEPPAGLTHALAAEVVSVVDRPQDIEDEEAMSFFGGSEGDADESQG